ncbi:Male sterility domain protein [Segniliparus rotundus DSM 44985]|uniref:Male sterility domain protein n=1 Tax=Segniliparus rotundus (strain ATCC BAA-972 / CDC 1076 / CIP 108378 / DSM 44985 / JCM 13578) TaxID=640132 RepID=D6ZBK2_SEGRD|nr:SDR family oxidoreductase [Segniliparus rotundus]ADG98954.1 Male sterility domain protein [Segniliparus rotundus DSM 44985]
MSMTSPAADPTGASTTGPTRYLVTGGTGFIGRRVIARLLARDPEALVHALVRRESAQKLDALKAGWPGGERVRALVGDIAEPGFAVSGDLPQVDHIVHLAAIYDMAASDQANRAANIDGTRHAVEVARRLGAALHHISSVAVAGDFKGEFTEEDFDLGQGFLNAYQETKFEAEKLVREAIDLTWRVYRPSAVLGDSRTGAIDKIDGPYYFFPLLSRLAKLPKFLPLAIPDAGVQNYVPVDFVADGVVALIHSSTAPGASGQRVFHLMSPQSHSFTDLYRALAPAIGGPKWAFPLPKQLVRPFLSMLKRKPLNQVKDLWFQNRHIPPAMLDFAGLSTTFTTAETEAALAPDGVRCPPLASYATKIWDYWYEHLDPWRFARPHPDGPLVGKVVLITGASSGIGRATAIKAAEKGAITLLVARNGEDLDVVSKQIRAKGGAAHPYVCDITDQSAVDLLVKTVLGEHGHVDFLVNNAGRSIRRTADKTLGRLHDLERTIAINYYGAAHLILALLPGMRARRSGHIVNITTIGVQLRISRFSAYIASKTALEGFSDCVAAEVIADNVTFTNIRMPLIRTPMIAPTDDYQSVRAATPEKAAAMVIRGLVERPAQIDTPGGSFMELFRIFFPKTNARILHQHFLMEDESQAAAAGDETGDEIERREREAPSAIPRNANPVMNRLRRGARRLRLVHYGRKAANLALPVHW